MPNANITGIPRPDVPFLDTRTNRVQREWFRFLQNLYVLTGGGSNATTVADLQVGPADNAATLELAQQAYDAAQAALLAPAATEGPQGPAGSTTFQCADFYCNTTQTAAVINTAYVITLDQTRNARGVSVAANHISVSVAGVYQIVLTINAHRTAYSAVASVFAWPTVNGVDLASGSMREVFGYYDSSYNVLLRGAPAPTLTDRDSPVTISRAYLVNLATTDYVSAKWATDSLDVELVAVAASAPYPALPSASLVISYVGPS